MAKNLNKLPQNLGVENSAQVLSCCLEFVHGQTPKGLILEKRNETKKRVFADKEKKYLIVSCEKKEISAGACTYKLFYCRNLQIFVIS
jgi:hypothetical protein